MKLFRIRAGKFPHVNTTRFSTSLSGAKRVADELTGSIQICSCNVSPGLALRDWIDLLETDSPGDQEIQRTAVDFMTDIKLVWERE